MIPSLPLARVSARLLAGCLTAVAAAQDGAEAALLEAFAHRPAAAQEHIVANLRQQLNGRDDPWSVAVMACIEDGAKAGTARGKHLPNRTPKQKPPAAGKSTDAWLPTTHEYVFGIGAIETSAVHDKAAAAAAERLATVHQALAGMLPDSDLAIASLLRQLDRDAGADAFAAFLVAWHHGDETFYEALDRTAGTKDSLFYYDAMLGDFVANFADGKNDEAAKVRSGLQASHDALHRAFLSYRQYRGFREAVALSAVLPIGQPLPHRLARYEAGGEGSYSLRQQVLMVLAVMDWDPRQLAAAIAASAPPLPQPLWSSDYDPFPAWNRIFTATQAKMIERAGSTDAWLQQAEAQRREVAAAIRATAEAVLREPTKAH